MEDEDEDVDEAESSAAAVVLERVPGLAEAAPSARPFLLRFLRAAPSKEGEAAVSAGAGEAEAPGSLRALGEAGVAC